MCALARIVVDSAYMLLFESNAAGEHGGGLDNGRTTWRTTWRRMTQRRGGRREDDAEEDDAKDLQSLVQMNTTHSPA